jgi:murein L,D-transpeptidase YafK
MRTLGLFLVSALLSGEAGAADRLARVRQARTADVKALVEKAGLSWPVDQVYLRVFKEERLVELWASNRPRDPMALVKSFPICAASGVLGPKRREGDLQVPEGLYEVAEFNPFSSYHLALKLSYPNASDRLRSDRQHPGGLIYLHGDCASIGCIAIEDGPVEELYLVAFDSKRRPLRIDVFPARLTRRWLEAAPAAHRAFWAELLPAYERFEERRRPPAFTVDRRSGAYVVTP